MASLTMLGASPNCAPMIKRTMAITTEKGRKMLPNRERREAAFRENFAGKIAFSCSVRRFEPEEFSARVSMIRGRPGLRVIAIDHRSICIAQDLCKTPYTAAFWPRHTPLADP